MKDVLRKMNEWGIDLFCVEDRSGMVNVHEKKAPREGEPKEWTDILST